MLFLCLQQSNKVSCNSNIPAKEEVHSMTVTHLLASFHDNLGKLAPERKTILDFNEKVTMRSKCKSSVLCSRQTTMPPPHHSDFLQATCSSWHPTNSIKALKANCTDWITYFSAVSSRKGIWPVKTEWWDAGVVNGYVSGSRCRFAYGPADATATHSLLLQ